jgi:hypothetical protein
MDFTTLVGLNEFGRHVILFIVKNRASLSKKKNHNEGLLASGSPIKLCHAGTIYIIDISTPPS